MKIAHAHAQKETESSTPLISIGDVELRGVTHGLLGWRRESLAEDLRRLAEAKRRVRREEAEEAPRVKTTIR